MSDMGGGVVRQVLGELLQTVFRKVYYVIGAGLVAVTGAFGGLDAVPQPPAAGEPVAVGEVVDCGRWTVAVTDVKTFTQLGDLHLKQDGNRWLVAIAKVTVTADRSMDNLYAMLRLPGTKGLTTVEPDRIILARDGNLIRRLHPSMTERVAFVWEQAGTEQAPTSLPVGVLCETHEDDPDPGMPEYVADTEPTAAVTVPVVAGATK
ncbi:hypothetical protein QEZ54_02460 [Catellatospora sp. KI3]|uniref:hypothetical protein n=1 Tax=Catellatospora sp. KI3 TaxID=3041620 RepID=UPI002482C7C9|nr:hypothetical protein [Catellatospora sp. KI3]MDI1459820.1 hypothetical protein [Catellatospora sp. KI3]